MKRLSLQWRITLMTVLLIGITCVAMNLLLCSSGVYYMDTIADSLQGGTVILNDGGAASFDPQLIAPNEELTIVADGVQGRFRTTNWYITAAVTMLSGIPAYFVSGRALKPLRSFASQVEQVQLELFSAEHPDVRPETAEFLTLLREQTERLTQMTKTLLEMSNLRQVARDWGFLWCGRSRSPRRLRLGGGKLGQGHDHRGGAAGRDRKRSLRRGYHITVLG